MLPLHRSLLAAALLALAFNCPSDMMAQNAANADGSQLAVPGPPPAKDSKELPDSPGTIWASLQQPSSQNGPAQSANAQQSQPNSQPAPTTATDQKTQRPVGTAAAEAPKVSGVTAAQPAGVAIAPAKQRRVRTVVLKVGAILGAGAAVGTVIALSAATPSKPPGAH